MRLRDRRRETLFIDARGLGTMETRTLKVLTDADIAKIADAYHAWRETGGRYADEPGFCKSATTEEIAAQGYVLTPGRYVGTAAAEEDDEPFEEKMERLTATLREQMAEGARSTNDQQGAGRGGLWLVIGEVLSLSEARVSLLDCDHRTPKRGKRWVFPYVHDSLEMRNGEIDVGSGCGKYPASDFSSNGQKRPRLARTIFLLSADATR